MNIGENIKKIRLEKGLTRQELAKALKVSDSTISRYENNKREPNIETLNKIAEVLDISTNELITGKSLFDGSLGLVELYKLILNKSFESENQEIKDMLIEDTFYGILAATQKNKPNFKTYEEYKKNICSYWEDVITLYPISKIDKFALDSLNNDEITEVATFLNLAFETKILEIKKNRDKKAVYKNFFGDSKNEF